MRPHLPWQSCCFHPLVRCHRPPLFDFLSPSSHCSPEDAIQQMEQKVNLLVEESAIASAEGNYQQVANITWV